MAAIEIFRTGNHTDSQGRVRTWTTADLDRMVSSYNPAQHEAPLVIGHPRDNGPAYGWVESLRRDGDRLLAEFRQVPDAVKTLVTAGRYKKRSISVYPDGRLRHVGLLGAVPPAVPGLADIQSFTAADAEGVSEYEEDIMHVTKPGDPTSDGAPQPDQTRSQAAPPPAPGADYSEGDLRATLAALTARLDTVEKDRDKLAADFREARAGQTRTGIDARLDRLVADGVTLPGERPALAEFASTLAASGSEYEFSDSQGKAAKRPLVDEFWSFLESRARHSLFREFREPAAPADSTAKPADLMSRV